MSMLEARNQKSRNPEEEPAILGKDPFRMAENNLLPSTGVIVTSRKLLDGTGLVSIIHYDAEKVEYNEYVETMRLKPEFYKGRRRRERRTTYHQRLPNRQRKEIILTGQARIHHLASDGKESHKVWGEDQPDPNYPFKLSIHSGDDTSFEPHIVKWFVSPQDKDLMPAVDMMLRK